MVDNSCDSIKSLWSRASTMESKFEFIIVKKTGSITKWDNCNYKVRQNPLLLSGTIITEWSFTPF